MTKLHSLKSLVKKRKTIGRGGKRGGTSTKGHKGQSARSGGKIRIGFEGGQMPLFRRLPKRGFTNAPFKQVVVIVNLLQIENGYDNGMHVDRTNLLEKGILTIKKGLQDRSVVLKVLGKGNLTKKLIITADAFSESAKKSIEALGGEARLTKEI